MKTLSCQTFIHIFRKPHGNFFPLEIVTSGVLTLIGGMRNDIPIDILLLLIHSRRGSLLMHHNPRITVPRCTLPRRSLFHHLIDLFKRQSYTQKQAKRTQAAQVEPQMKNTFAPRIASSWSTMYGVVYEMTKFHSQFAAVERAMPLARIGKGKISPVTAQPVGPQDAAKKKVKIQVLCRWCAWTLTNRYDQRDGESVVDASLLEECGAEIEEVDAGCGKISQYGFLLTIAQTKMRILDCFQMEKEYIRLTQLLNHLHCHSEKANVSGCFL